MPYSGTKLGALRTSGSYRMSIVWLCMKTPIGYDNLARLRASISFTEDVAERRKRLVDMVPIYIKALDGGNDMIGFISRYFGRCMGWRGQWLLGHIVWDVVVTAKAEPHFAKAWTIVPSSRSVVKLARGMVHLSASVHLPWALCVLKTKKKNP